MVAGVAAANRGKAVEKWVVKYGEGGSKYEQKNCCHGSCLDAVKSPAWNEREKENECQAVYQAADDKSLLKRTFENIANAACCRNGAERPK
jgi:hypothetical protein